VVMVALLPEWLTGVGDRLVTVCIQFLGGEVEQGREQGAMTTV